MPAYNILRELENSNVVKKFSLYYSNIDISLAGNRFESDQSMNSHITNANIKASFNI